MVDHSSNGGDAPEPRLSNPEAALGGADAVEKTTYVVGSGTEPETMKPGSTGPKAATGAGQNATWIIIALLVVAAVLVYLLGFGR